MDVQQARRPWWKREPFLRIPVWVLIVVVVVIGAIGVSTATKNDDDTTTPTVPAGVEACDALADPANANLHPSDWRRIGHWTQSEMEAYVTAHCPDQLSKVSE